MQVLSESSEVLSMIFNLMGDLAALDPNDIPTNPMGTGGSSYSYSSAAKSASELIAVFPILCSSNVSRDTASMLTVFTESKASTSLQLTLSAHAQSIGSSSSGIEHLRNFHQNLDLRESVEVKVNAQTLKSVHEKIKRSFNIYYESDYSETSLDEYMLDPDETYVINIRAVNEYNYRDDYYRNSPPRNPYQDEKDAIERDKRNLEIVGANLDQRKKNQFKSEREFEKYKQKERDKLNKGKDNLDNYHNQETTKRRIEDEQRDKRDKKYDKKEDTLNRRQEQLQRDIDRFNDESRFGNMRAELMNNDVKKINDAAPSLLVVKFTNANNNIVTEFVIGIKAKLVPTNYTEILKKIYNKNRDRKGLVNLLRMTTGELSFARDYLLNIDRAKDDIRAMKQKGSREQIWKALENRSERAKILLRMNKVNYASAITTVVITSDDADLLYKEENIDIYNPREARRFIESYNLFGLLITNDAEEVLYVMHDEKDGYFEKIAYGMLEKNSSGNDMKKILTLMTKMR